MDPRTLEIAHFAGVFDLLIEELRLRYDYLRFKQKRAEEQDDEPIESAGVRIQAPYQLEPYDPGLAYTPEGLASAPLPIPQRLGAYDHGEVWIAASQTADEMEWAENGTGFSPAGPVTIIVPPTDIDIPFPQPGSIVTVTVQVATLSDNDLFRDGLNTKFTSPDKLEAKLEAIAQQADALSGLDLPELPTNGDWAGFSHKIIKQFDSAEEISAEQLAADGIVGEVETATFRGEDAAGTVVNGEKVDEAPAWKDLLPSYMRPDDDDEAPAANAGKDEDGAGEGPNAVEDGKTIVRKSSGTDDEGTVKVLAEHDFKRDFGDDAPDPDGLEPGHEVVAGANMAINEVVITSKWLDAPVFVVQGDVVRFDAINQVNVLVEHDSVDGVAVSGSDSVGYNIASITAESSADPDAPAVNTDVLPSLSFVVRVEADLIQINWIKQVTFVTDFDRIEMTFSASATFLGTGENEIVNTTVLNEFGYFYDAIFVSGDMVDGTVVTQKNVLFDSDKVVTGATAVAEAGSVTPAAATDGTAGPGAGSDAAPTLSLSDNLLLNQATVKTTGIDTFEDMKQSFAKTAEDLSNGADELARDVTQDALFAGKEALRALQIDGDLIKMNIIEQITVMGDADQIRLEMQALRDKIDAEMKVIAGSNALLNITSVNELGMDSTIMAGGQIYDDALIHQAELFDTDATPTGVAMTDLTNEAVAAFLSDSILEVAEVSDGIAPMIDYDGVSQLDVMQTALG
ncbi:hypothetical protein [Paracoccus marinaquae]|uniref:Uncharacterized protein n=1 Tax=Paracoccus marinaquae TaxID=2841926 RepID=A0ABS6AJ45_9RHOB|nr:hypothetical protein [Paracoccus marinaquae]MBU3030615.1 hypothetical protein [Paracoccus marinaquae]